MGEKVKCTEITDAELKQICAGIGFVVTKPWFGAAEGGDEND